MNKIFIILFLICVSICLQAQILPHKAPSQNTHWLDSMKRIVNKGFELNTQGKNNWKKQLTYVNTCTNLGRYYEWAYDEHYVKNMSLALKYYNKVIDLGRFPDEPIYFKALAIRTNIYRKLADIYFKGKGVKWDKTLSLEFALDGIGSNIKLIDFYSKRYFGNMKKEIYLSNYFTKTNDSTFTFLKTSISKKSKLFYFYLIKNKLIEIGKIFNSKKDSLDLIINFASEMSIRGQVYSYKCTDYIKKILVTRCKINYNKIEVNIEFEDIDDKLFTIFIQKKESFQFTY
jgi:hypothetical protein